MVWCGAKEGVVVGDHVECDVLEGVVVDVMDVGVKRVHVELYDRVRCVVSELDGVNVGMDVIVGIGVEVPVCVCVMVDVNIHVIVRVKEDDGMTVEDDEGETEYVGVTVVDGDKE